MRNPNGPMNLVQMMHGKVIYLLVLVTIVQTIYPITAGGSVFWLLVYQVLYMGLMVTGYVVARESVWYKRVLLAVGVVWIVAGAYFAFNQTSLVGLFGGYGAIIIFQTMVVRVLLEYIFRAPVVDRDVIYAACAVYLLLGAIFVPVYGIIETLTFVTSGGAHAFSDGVSAVGEIIPWQTFTYYSYVTLTTAGYGDILPVTMWARSAASLEAIIGVLYITIIMARLVGLYASSREQQD